MASPDSPPPAADFGISNSGESTGSRASGSPAAAAQAAGRWVSGSCHPSGCAPQETRGLRQGEDVNATDETGWTALMAAAVAVQPQAVSILLDAGPRSDPRDHHRDTALIGAAAV